MSGFNRLRKRRGKLDWCGLAVDAILLPLASLTPRSLAGIPVVLKAFKAQVLKVIHSPAALTYGW